MDLGSISLAARTQCHALEYAAGSSVIEGDQVSLTFCFLAFFLPFLDFLFPCVFSLRFFLAFCGLSFLAFWTFPCLFVQKKFLVFLGVLVAFD